MVSEREIEAAFRFLNIGYRVARSDVKKALEAAARVRAENDAFQDAVVTGLGAVKMNADGTTERVDLRAEENAGEPVAWAYELANFYTEDRGYYDFELQISKVDPRKTWEIAPDRIRNIRPLYSHPAPQPSGTVEAEAEIACRALEEIIRRADPSKLSPIQYEAAAAAAKIAKNALNIRGEIRAVNVPTDMFPTPPTAGGGDE